MLPPLPYARLVVVFGEQSFEMAHRLRDDAISGGLAPVIVGDALPIEGSRYARLLRRIALDLNGLIILDLGGADPYRVKAALSVADFALVTSNETAGALQLLSGDSVWVKFPPQKPRPARPPLLREV
jgi:hypothetical protein